MSSLSSISSLKKKVRKKKRNNMTTKNGNFYKCKNLAGERIRPVGVGGDREKKKKKKKKEDK